MTLTQKSLTAAILAVALGPATALATIPYTPFPGPFYTPFVGPGVQPPPSVFGKEYSHDRDHSAMPPGGIPDPQQVIAWDGLGGTGDGVDFTGTRPSWDPDQQVDAIANHRDTFFDETLRDESHLIFSHDDLVANYVGGPGAGVAPTPLTVPSGGPVVISNGNTIGGAGEVSVEESGVFGPPSSQFIWAKQPEVNGMPLPRDVDGLEVWGPEDPIAGEFFVFGDTDKYSLETDAPSGVSVWNGSGSMYIDHPTIISAVTALLGPMSPSTFSMKTGEQGERAINVDALMVSDTLFDHDRFNKQFDKPGGDELLDQNGTFFFPSGPDGGPRGDTIIFSISQLVDDSDPDGYYATGSELFVLDSLGGVSFLFHGGHVWDKGYALSDLALITPGGPLPGDANNDGKVDILDLDILSANFGTSPAVFGTGDFNGDGVVDILDLDILSANFGAMGSLPDEFAVIDINGIEAIGTQDLTFPNLSLATASVPEPTAALLALAALGVVAAGRRG